MLYCVSKNKPSDNEQKKKKKKNTQHLRSIFLIR
jgi:hypothetical protein